MPGLAVAAQRLTAELPPSPPEIAVVNPNELPNLYRPTLHLPYGRLCDLREDLERLNAELKVLVQQHPNCRRLTALEGMGPEYRIPELPTGCVKRSPEGVQRETMFR